MLNHLSRVKAATAFFAVLLLSFFANPAIAGQASLAWNASASSNVTGYKVHYGTASRSYSTHVDVQGALSTTVPNLTAGTTYFFAVTAYNAAGESGYSNEASAAIPTPAPAPDTQAPSLPTNPAASANGTAAINLNWTASTDNVGVTSYRVERCQGAGCASFAQVGAPTGTSYGDAGLAAGTSYSYRVRASDAAGNLSGYSAVATAMTTTAPDTQAPSSPTNPAASASGTSAISLNWNASSDNVGVASYRVERCQGASCASFAQVGAPTGTSYGDTGLTAGTSYSYRVRASDAAGNLSGYSSVATASTSAATSPLAADFSANRTAGSAPMPVVFTDASSGTINSYAWDFGDGGTSTEKNPSHIYANAGIYAVSLTVSGSGGTKSIAKTGFIKVGMDNDLVVDFGAAFGIWQWFNNANWSQLHGTTSRRIIMADVDHNGQQDQVVDFGSRYGIWMKMNNSFWKQLHWATAVWTAKADVDDNGQDDVIADFGAQYGIYIYMNGSSWRQIHSVTAKQAVVADIDHNGRDDVAIDFGSQYGVWAYMNGGSGATAWRQLDARSPTWMIKADVDHNGQDDLAMSFGAGTGTAQAYPGKGVWAYLNGTAWRQLDARAVASARAIAIDIDHNGQDDLIIDYVNQGLWHYRNDTDWVQLHSVSGKNLAQADLDSNGESDLVVDFGSRYGIHAYMNGKSWTQLHGVTASGMAAGQVDGR